jgi:hypothetical protein
MTLRHHNIRARSTASEASHLYIENNSSIDLANSTTDLRRTSSSVLSTYYNEGSVRLVGVTFSYNIHAPHVVFDSANCCSLKKHVEQDPTDGPKVDVWYCANCGDGPYAAWQVSCANVNCHRNKSAGYHSELCATSDPWMTYDRPPVPKDGPVEVVWFCGECGDGPYCDWQVHCAICQHAKCGTCREEEK